MSKKYIFETLKTIAESVEPINSSKHAAAIVKRNKIIAIGFNHKKSHPFQKKYSKNEHAIYFHAEVHSIYNALKKIPVEELSKCDLYVLRVTRDNQVAESCPCKGCQMAIHTFGIKNTYFSTEENQYKNL